MPATLVSTPPRRTGMRRVRALVGCTALVVACFAAGYLLAPTPRSGPEARWQNARSWLPRPMAIGEFSLDVPGGEPDTFTRERLLGQWTLMYFGYSHCPDLCSPALEALARVSRELSERRRDLRVAGVFVTVDPSRDSPARLRDYLSRTDARIVALYGSERTIAELAGQMGLLYTRDGPDAAGRYRIDHPATILLIDPRARLRAGFSAPHDAHRIVEDILETLPEADAAEAR